MYLHLLEYKVVNVDPIEKWVNRSRYE